ncbi:MAG: NAD(P)H-hydrate epimerase, partial [Saprospiraceae bacterium]|nr:NAD(P)H-hydrate epimerase [Saprospiraceae bacterium]
MKYVLHKSSIQDWDQYTICEEPIESLDLMWRASNAFCEAFFSLSLEEDRPIHVFCGSGNNGGDGIAISLILDKAFRNVRVHLLTIGTASEERSDMEKQLKASPHIPVTSYTAHQASSISIEAQSIIIDAIFGIGINGPIRAPWNVLIDALNSGGHDIISVDTPSGLMMDQLSQGSIIRAKHTITFQSPKLSQLIPENDQYFGQLHIVDIGLHPDFRPENILASYIEHDDISTLIRSRSNYDHKGSFGHACITGGSIGMMGAIILAARACMRSGVGKLTLNIPSCGMEILQKTVPEAMVMTNGEHNMNWFTQVDHYNALCVGCGLGQDPDTKAPLLKLLDEVQAPLVIDADALNIIADQNKIDFLPDNTVITPHLKEFDRLFGSHNNNFERFETALNMASLHNIV